MFRNEIFGVSCFKQTIYQFAFSWSKHLHLYDPSLPRINNGAGNVAGSSLC
ncbi:hypothetical protein EMPG_14238 [Blastomyces silverae]|uniref:Uncharacterized protein n=1 Tax=Blastomyces silverae TaxID=2060906 RepID=A0A0H1BH84_9EURO|nr:hypothetical protein EMPG_14238 [Blastomyces silverae]